MLDDTGFAENVDSCENNSEPLLVGIDFSVKARSAMVEDSRLSYPHRMKEITLEIGEITSSCITKRKFVRKWCKAVC